MVPDILNATPEEDAPPDSEPKPEAHTGIQQTSALLNLPIEIFQTITWHMDIGTFFISLLTCKFFLAAAQSRPNLHRHIGSLPGLKLGFDSITTPDLLLQFRRRAAESGCAAGVLSDLTLYGPASRIPLRNTVFSPACPGQPGTVPRLATVDEDGAIQIYDLGKHHIRHKAELQIKPTEDDNGRRIEIQKMAFSPESQDLAVLYRSYITTCHFECRKQTEFSDLGDPTYKLVTFPRLHAKTKKYFYSSSQQGTRNINVSNDDTPVGLALASNGYACISWKQHAKQNETKVLLIGRHNKFTEANSHDPEPDVLRIADSYKDRLIFGVRFVENDKKLNLSKPGIPIHSWFLPVNDPSYNECLPISTNMALLNIENVEDDAEKFVIGMPFHATHSYGVTVDWSAAAMCGNSYLALGMAKHPREPTNHRDVFIVQAESIVFSSDCQHRIFPEEGRKIQSWEPLAFLAGYRQGTSSLGTVIAVSPEGTRIAAATWSRVLIWSFSPKLLLQGELQHYFPTHDYNPRKGFGRLRPTLLPSQGVVHSMLWANETQLYATTDRGLAKWDIGHRSEGEREHLTLAYDDWPDTALAAPVSGSKLQQRRPRQRSYTNSKSHDSAQLVSRAKATRR